MHAFTVNKFIKIAHKLPAGKRLGTTDLGDRIKYHLPTMQVTFVDIIFNHLYLAKQTTMGTINIKDVF